MYGPPRLRPDDPRNNKQQTRDYRYQLTHDILTTISRGDCCSVVGVGSCGKSRLLLHLSRPDTLQYHLGDKGYDLLVIPVQCNAFQGDTPWHAYEGIARDMIETLEKLGQPAASRLRDELEEHMYTPIIRDKEIAFTHLKRGIDYLIKESRGKVTLSFDEFDFVFQRFEPTLFRNLRALRNANKYNLMYLTTTRMELQYLRDTASYADIEEFLELFTDNAYAIGPYDERDAAEMITDLENRLEFKLKKATRELLYWVTGGHSGLIGAAFRTLQSQPNQPASQREIYDMLADQTSISGECNKIWDSLPRMERNTLRRLAIRSRLSNDEATIINALTAKGLVRDSGNRTVEIFSPVFEHYVSGRAEEK